MRPIASLMLAGAAALALSWSAAFAAQPAPAVHAMTIRLQDGSTAQIQYTGNIAPKIVIAPENASPAVFGFTPSLFAPDPAFATLDRISHEMDHEMAGLMKEAQVLSLAPAIGLDQVKDALAQQLPPGSEGYSLVSTWSGNEGCMRSVEITTFANGKKPKIVSHVSGSCTAPSNGQATSAVYNSDQPQPQAENRPGAHI